MPLPGFLSNLTNPALVYPDESVKYFPNKAARGIQFAKDEQRTVQPSTVDIPGSIEGGLGDVNEIAPQNTPAPQMAQPTYGQAQSPMGGDLQNPALSKGGKLLSFLTRVTQGGLAGRAASEQAVAASGGHSSVGFGTGFEAAQQANLQRAQMPLQYQQELQKTQLGQMELQPVQTPYGTMPMGTAAKSYLPWLAKGQFGLAGKQIEAGSRENVAGTQAASREKVARIEQGMGVPLDPQVAQMVGMDELANVPMGRGSWTNINKALEAKGYRIQDMGTNGPGPNAGMWLMDRAGNRIKQTSPNSLVFQRGASFAQNRPEVVTDPNDPGYAYFTTAAEAMSKHLPSVQGAATTAAKTEARSEVPTKIGDQKVAFNTAIQHADLLKTAATALANGDVQTVNSLKNRFKNEFGWAGPVTAEAIADAYTREVTKMLSAGHLTDSEIATVGKTLNPSRQSMEQVLGVIDAYKALSQSKLNVLNQQSKASIAPRKPPSGGTKSDADPFGIR